MLVGACVLGGLALKRAIRPWKDQVREWADTDEFRRVCRGLIADELRHGTYNEQGGEGYEGVRWLAIARLPERIRDREPDRVTINRSMVKLVWIWGMARHRLVMGTDNTNPNPGQRGQYLVLGLENSRQ